MFFHLSQVIVSPLELFTWISQGVHLVPLRSHEFCSQLGPTTTHQVYTQFPLQCVILWNPHQAYAQNDSPKKCTLPTTIIFSLVVKSQVLSDTTSHNPTGRLIRYCNHSPHKGMQHMMILTLFHATQRILHLNYTSSPRAYPYSVIGYRPVTLLL
jgi:hypothetical protein